MAVAPPGPTTAWQSASPASYNPTSPSYDPTQDCVKCKFNRLQHSGKLLSCDTCHNTLCRECSRDNWVAGDKEWWGPAHKRETFIMPCLGCDKIKCYSCWPDNHVPDPFCDDCCGDGDTFCGHCRTQKPSSSEIVKRGAYSCIDCKAKVGVCRSCLKDKDGIEFDESDLICSGCLEDYVKCTGCREVISKTDIGKDDEGYCEECAHKMWVCGDCNDKFQDDVKQRKTSSKRNPVYLCDSCDHSLCLKCWGGFVDRGNHKSDWNGEVIDEESGFVPEFGKCHSCAYADNDFEDNPDKSEDEGEEEEESEKKKTEKKRLRSNGKATAVTKKARKTIEEADKIEKEAKDSSSSEEEEEEEEEEADSKEESADESEEAEPVVVSKKKIIPVPVPVPPKKASASGITMLKRAASAISTKH